MIGDVVRDPIGDGQNLRIRRIVRLGIDRGIVGDGLNIQRDNEIHEGSGAEREQITTEPLMIPHAIQKQRERIRGTGVGPGVELRLVIKPIAIGVRLGGITPKSELIQVG